MLLEAISPLAVLIDAISFVFWLAIGEVLILPLRFKLRTKEPKEFKTPAPIDLKELKPAESKAEYSEMPEAVDGDSALKHFLKK